MRAVENDTYDPARRIGRIEGIAREDELFRSHGLRIREDVLNVTYFCETAVIDDRNAVADLLYHRHLMRDDDYRKFPLEIDLLDKKASTPRKPTATQVENESLRAELLSFLVSVDTLKSIKEIQEECSTFAELSNQRMSHLLTALVNDGKVEKTYVKKTPYYCAK